MKIYFRNGFVVLVILLSSGLVNSGCSEESSDQNKMTLQEVEQMQGATLVYEEAQLAADDEMKIYREIDEAETSSELIKYLDISDPFILRHLIFRLGQIDNNNSKDALIDLWEKGDAYQENVNHQEFSNLIVRTALAAQIIKIDDHEEKARDFIKSQTENPLSVVRSDVAESLIFIKDSDAFMVISKLVADSDHHVATKAIQSLEKIYETSGKQAILVSVIQSLESSKSSMFPDIAQRYHALSREMLN